MSKYRTIILSSGHTVGRYLGPEKMKKANNKIQDAREHGKDENIVFLLFFFDARVGDVLLPSRVLGQYRTNSTDLGI